MGAPAAEGLPLDKTIMPSLQNLVRQLKAMINPPKVKHGKTGGRRLVAGYN